MPLQHRHYGVKLRGWVQLRLASRSHLHLAVECRIGPRRFVRMPLQDHHCGGSGRPPGTVKTLSLSSTFFVEIHRYFKNHCKTIIAGFVFNILGKQGVQDDAKMSQEKEEEEQERKKRKKEWKKEREERKNIGKKKDRMKEGKTECKKRTTKKKERIKK